MAVSYDEALVAAMHARSLAVDLEATVGGLTAARHDRWTLSEASVALDAVLDAARAAEEARRATAFAADVASRIPPLGVDPELERMEFIVAFHESGHATYAAQSRIMRPVSAEIDVKRKFLVGVTGCGVVSGEYTKDPQKWTERDYIDSAAVSLAGSAAECYWLQRVEGADYRTSLQEAYATHSSYDYRLACDDVGEGTAEFRKAERWARAVVEQQWDHIAGMAEILRDKERMSAGQIGRAA